MPLGQHEKGPSERVKTVNLQLGREELEPLATRLEEEGANIIDFSSYILEKPRGPIEPPQHVAEAVRKATQSAWQAPETRGYLSLREEVAKVEKADKGVEIDPRTEILITNGGVMQGIYNMLQATINPGDEVLMFRPGLTFDDQVRMAEGIPVFVDLREQDGYRFNPEDIERAISQKTKVMILNTPHNPTGHVASKRELQSVAEVVERSDLAVFSDEILWKWTYDDHKHVSFASLPGMAKHTSIFSGLTKSGMFDYRLGWVCASPEMISQLEKIMFWQNEITPPICQIAALAHLPKLKEWIRPLLKEQSSRRDLMHAGLTKAGIPCFKPEGTLTMFPNISGFGKSSLGVSRRLLENTHVLVAPGVRYGGEGHLRLGFHKTREETETGIQRIAKFTTTLAAK